MTRLEQQHRFRRGVSGRFGNLDRQQSIRALIESATLNSSVPRIKPADGIERYQAEESMPSHVEVSGFNFPYVHSNESLSKLCTHETSFSDV